MRILRFMKKEAVFTVSFVLAVGSMALTPPSLNYLGYIDFDVLMLLFCLMAVVSGLKNQGVFDSAAGWLVGKAKNLRLLSAVLIALCFFSSMVVTNDVALLTFVPLTLGVLSAFPDTALKVVVLQTIAANLGSMTTPIGNPQNLYLFSRYQLSAGAFFSTMAPLTVISAVLLALCCLLIHKTPLEIVSTGAKALSPKPPHFILLALCLLSVFHVLPKWVVFAVALAALLIFDRKALLGVDYMLLLTFCCFFVFVGNLSALTAVRDFMARWITGNELISGVLCSQVISNVPAALMLAPFTENWRGLMLGVNIGGLGTLIASLASLISFRLYAKAENAATGKFLLKFTIYNIAFLALLLCAVFLLNK